VVQELAITGNWEAFFKKEVLGSGKEWERLMKLVRIKPC
jgi:hypothetical protein